MHLAFELNNWGVGGGEVVGTQSRSAGQHLTYRGGGGCIWLLSLIIGGGGGVAVELDNGVSQGHQIIVNY